MLINYGVEQSWGTFHFKSTCRLLNHQVWPSMALSKEWLKLGASTLEPNAYSQKVTVKKVIEKVSSHSFEEILFYYIREIRFLYDWQPINSSPHLSYVYVDISFSR